MSGHPVKLYVYDLSQGMARQMSLALTGKQIDGIWHTAVVVYGREFSYGQGILSSVPGATHLGPPLEVIDMGETHLPEEVVLEYIESQREVFTPEKYHLLDFNCNTFSNDLCQFLTGKSIPKHISDLPSDFLKTPFGRSMLPMIENMFGKSQLGLSVAGSASGAVPPSGAAAADTASLGILRDVSAAALSAAPGPSHHQQQPKPLPVQTANNLATLERWIQSYRAVIVFFTSATCPPCQMIKPSFERLLEEKNEKGSRIKILGVIVDTSMAFDAATKYSIRATPTFILFKDGQKFSEFRGANYAELQSSVNLLLFTVYPPHPHRKIQLRDVLDLPNNPVLYGTIGKLDVIYSKLQDFLQQNNLQLDDSQRTTLDVVKKRLNDTSEEARSPVNFSDWRDLVDMLLDKLPIDQLFPVFDIFRMLIVTQEACDYYLNDCSQLLRVIEIGQKENNVPKATLLMILRITCNLFKHTGLITTYFMSKLPNSSHRGPLTQLLINSLLSSETQVRQTAAALAFNCSTIVANERLKKEEEEEGYLSGVPQQEDDDWQIEIVSAMMDVLGKEKEEEVVHRLLAAIAKFLFLAPPKSSSLADLLSALDIKGVLQVKKEEKVIKSSKVLTLARDVEQLVQQSLTSD